MGIEMAETPETNKAGEPAAEEKSKKIKKAAAPKTAKKKALKPAEQEQTEEPAAKESAVEAEAPEEKIGTPKELKIEAQEIEPKPEEKIEIAKPAVKKAVKNKEWQDFDEPAGQLGIDVYQTATDLVIQSAIAGVRPENLEISLERDVVTIKGIREKPFPEDGDYFTQECYWGPFSRQVIMPVEVDPDKTEASMKEGILTVRIPKILREKKRTIKVRI